MLLGEAIVLSFLTRGIVFDWFNTPQLMQSSVDRHVSIFVVWGHSKQCCCEQSVHVFWWARDYTFVGHNAGGGGMLGRGVSSFITVYVQHC